MVQRKRVTSSRVTKAKARTTAKRRVRKTGMRVTAASAKAYSPKQLKKRFHVD